MNTTERKSAQGKAQFRCVFHATWTPIPGEAGQPFHVKLDSLGATRRGVLSCTLKGWSGSNFVGFGSLGWFGGFVTA